MIDVYKLQKADNEDETNLYVLAHRDGLAVVSKTDLIKLQADLKIILKEK